MPLDPTTVVRQLRARHLKVVAAGTASHGLSFGFTDCVQARAAEAILRDLYPERCIEPYSADPKTLCVQREPDVE